MVNSKLKTVSKNYCNALALRVTSYLSSNHVKPVVSLIYSQLLMKVDAKSFMVWQVHSHKGLLLNKTASKSLEILTVSVLLFWLIN